MIFPSGSVISKSLGMVILLFLFRPSSLQCNHASHERTGDAYLNYSSVMSIRVIPPLFIL